MVRGFSLIEVLAALLILSVSIVALSQNQAQSVRLIETAQNRDQALILATSKMNEIDRRVQERGLADLKDAEKGEFDQERYEGFEWNMRKQKIPVPDFVSLVTMATGQSASEDSDEEFDTSAMQGPLKRITDIWGKAIRQVTVEVTWKDNERDTEYKSYELVTHYVEQDAFNQVQGLIGSFGASSNAEESE